MKDRKGIILAGGSGTRLYPNTLAVSKQLLPVYDKPMVYYPLTILMLAGINEILVITTPEDQLQFQRLLGDGSQWGIKLEYVVQPNPDGLAQAFILAEDFLCGAPSALILGDNIFFGQGLVRILKGACENKAGATIFCCEVTDPERYGVVDFDQQGNVNSIEEKPKKPSSNFAVTGLYFVDETAPSRAKKILPSNRNEIEITCLLESYLMDEKLVAEYFGRGFAWFDTGTHDALLDASNFVRTLVHRQALQVGSPDEVAFVSGWINKKRLNQSIEVFQKSEYGAYLKKLIEKDS